MTQFDEQTKDGWLKPHREDDWCDTVHLVSDNCPYSFTIHLQERFKTSEMSGDEWRFSAVCQVCQEATVLGSESYGDLQAAFSFFPRLVATPTIDESLIRPRDEFTATYFYKGRALLTTVYSNLIEAMFCLPGAWYEAPEQKIDFDTVQESRKALCSQPGCCKFPVSLFKLKQEYDRQGKEEEGFRPAYRQFCADHLHRGDCSLEDADVNYELMAGISPDDRAVDPAKLSPSQVVYVGGEP